MFYPPFFRGGYWGQIQWLGEGQGTPWMSRQLIAGPLLMAVAATQVPTVLGFSILLKENYLHLFISLFIDHKDHYHYNNHHAYQ